VDKTAKAIATLGTTSQATASQISQASTRIQESTNERLNREVKEKYDNERQLGIARSKEQLAERRARSAALKERVRERIQSRQAELKANKDEADNVAKQQEELSRNFMQNEVKAAVEQYRTLERIRDDALQSERDAIREGSVFAIRDIREKANRDLAQSASSFKDATADRLVDFRTQFAEMMQSINPAAAQGQFSAVNSYQQSRTGNITINANGLDQRQAQTLVQQTLQRTYR